MGLSGIQVMTDTQSMAVRGKGYSGYSGHHYDIPTSSAIAYGRSYAKVAAYGGKAGSYDGFYSEHPYNAYGFHGSIAGVNVSYPKGPGGPGPKVYGNGGPKPPHKPPHHKPQPKRIVAFSGGFAFAH